MRLIHPLGSENEILSVPNHCLTKVEVGGSNPPGPTNFLRHCFYRCEPEQARAECPTVISANSA